MSVIVLLELNVQEDKSSAMIQMMKEILPDTRAFAGCQGVEVVQNQDKPTEIILIERWESRAHYEKYFAWRNESGSLDKLGSMVASPPSIRYFDPRDA